MNILSFSKLTKPIYEGGTLINLRPQGRWLVEVRRTDGTLRRPFADWIDNLFLDGYADGQLGGSLGAATGFGWNSLGTTAAAKNTFLDLFYGTRSSIAVGSGTTPVQTTDTALDNAVRFDSLPSSAGNSISWDSNSGNIVYSIKEEFPAETGSVTYTEAGIRIEGGTSTAAMNGLTTTGSNRLINRVVFPGSVSLDAGEQLILTVAVTIPTLASAAGKTITIAAQNGVNVSGVLKCIASEAAIAGGTVTAAGAVPTKERSHPLLFNTGDAPQALLGTQTSFDPVGTNPSWGTTNLVTGTWGTYTNGSRTRDIGYQWSPGVPASDTNFRSILFRAKAPTAGIGGYQLLLDDQMTKASAATLSISLRFSI